MDSTFGVTAVMGLATLVNLATHVGLLVLVATVVRRHRPDAAGSLLTWAITGLVLALVSIVLRPLAMAVFRASGTSDIMQVQIVLTLIGMVSNLVMTVLLVRGLVALAQPPKPAAIEGTPPYR